MKKSVLLRTSIQYYCAFFGLFVILSTPKLSAQKVELGIRAGLHTGSFLPKEQYYKGTWERTNGLAADLFTRLQLSRYLYAQVGFGYYQRKIKGQSEVSSFQGGFELEGGQDVYNFQFILGGRTAQENRKLYGFGALGFTFGNSFNKDFDKAIWFKSPVKVQINGEESSFLLEAGLGYRLSKRLKTELSLRYLPTQFNTSQESLTVIVPNLNSNWTINALSPGISIIFH